MAENKKVEMAENKKVEKEVKTTEKQYIVKTQIKDFNGTVAGVQFAYGRSAVPVKEGWILNWFKEKGYEIEEA